MVYFSEQFLEGDKAALRAEIVSGLRERGYDDPSVREAITLWYDRQEALRGPEYGSEIKDMIEIAEMLNDAGLKDLAREALEDALKNAWQGLGDAELADSIEDKIASL